MTSTSTWSRTLSIALSLAACGTAAVAVPAAAAPAATPDARGAEQYWTAERLAGAQPVDAGRGTAPPAAALRSPGVAAAAPRNVKQGTLGGGIPSVGTFFAAGPSGATYCSASVVRSAGKNLVLTAGHCAKSLKADGRTIFVPQFRKGKDAAHQPFGVFPVQRVFMDPRYRSNSKQADSDLDFAFVRVGPNAQRAKVESRTGGLRLTNTPRWTSTVTVYGYPKSKNPGQQAVSCTVDTSRAPKFRQLKMECGGFYGGVSGGPWIANYDAKRKTGDVIGNVGGYNGGGDDQNHDWVSYSPVYDREIQALYADAVAGRAPSRGPLRSLSGPRLPESARTMSFARHLAAGEFTGDGREDLVVVWRDGEATLYPGDGKGGFGAGRQLMRKHSAWERIQTITAGDFTGNGRSDLMVVWTDTKGKPTGKVSVFADGSASGPGKEHVVAKSGSMWKDASRITAGKYTSGRANDVAVVWRDGEVTLHTGASGSGTGKERRLAASGPTWKGAAALTTGQFSGGAARLVVRWGDGQLQTVAATKDLKSRATLMSANRAYRGDSPMVAGAFTAPAGRADDLLVRWAGKGETALYAGSGEGRLGAWSPLVSP
ncbi:trypsin-like serine protease [Streptomyces sp. AV19]|uniref:trypsin-like serine peptidase n=1 Tax=Streptomyces sp. AV19 TaxID=2793068 RepID=UPI0018FE9554|nr:trypsin-like serine protease [Streptomyces sp. AV19]MBH1938391.1 trypsin-like serine protease [Streptomyces sp. AV19]MDG4535040.1 FG-GAP-like repeat-containing protein [Streptomyces sp. AV19]